MMPSKTPQNLFADLPVALPAEVSHTLLRAGTFRIERIISRGHTSPEGFWYDQEEHEWVLLISGAARLRVEGEQPIEMVSGSYLNIPAHQRHRVEWTDPDQLTIWVGIYYSEGERPDDER